jgi:HSP20 family protein
MHDAFDSLIQDFFADPWLSSQTMQSEWLPQTDIREETDRYLITMDIPGMRKEDLRISVQNGMLTIQGERRRETEDAKEGRFARYERFHGSFTRTFQLPNTVDVRRIDAEYKDGVLALAVPKSEEAKPKEVEIKVH